MYKRELFNDTVIHFHITFFLNSYYLGYLNAHDSIFLQARQWFLQMKFFIVNYICPLCFV